MEMIHSKRFAENSNDSGRLDSHKFDSDRIQPFFSKQFDAVKFAEEYYKTHTSAQAELFINDLKLYNEDALKELDEKVFRGYNQLSFSLFQLKAMEVDLRDLHRKVLKADSLLSGIETTATKLSGLLSSSSYSENSPMALKTKKIREPEMSLSSLSQCPAIPSEIQDTSDLAHLKGVLAHQGAGEVAYKWVIEAPMKLTMLLRIEEYEQAAKLIHDVRQCKHEHMSDFEISDTYHVRAAKLGCKFIERKAQVLGDKLTAMLRNDDSGNAMFKMDLNGSKKFSRIEENKPDVKLGMTGYHDLNAFAGKSEKTSLVRVLKRLEMENEACREFLSERSKHVSDVANRIILSSLARGREDCILHLGTKLEAIISRTLMDFNTLFVDPEETGGALKGGSRLPDENENVECDEKKPAPIEYCLHSWTRQVTKLYVSVFAKLFLPELYEPLTASESSIREIIQTIRATGQKLVADDMEIDHAFSMATLFEFERKPTSELRLPLSQDQWRDICSCLRKVSMFCSSLEGLGVDADYLIVPSIIALLCSAVDSLFDQAERSLRSALSAESWSTKQVQMGSSQNSSKLTVLSLTPSGFMIYSIVEDIIRKVRRLHAANISGLKSFLEPKIAFRFASLLQVYLGNLQYIAGCFPIGIEELQEKFEEIVRSATRRGEAMQSTLQKLENVLKRPLTAMETRVAQVLGDDVRLSEKQRLGMLSNVLFVSFDLHTRVRTALGKFFTEEIDSFKACEAMHIDPKNKASPWTSFSWAFVSRQSQRLLADDLKWSHLDYSGSPQSVSLVSANGGNTEVSENFSRLTKGICDLKERACAALGNHHFCDDLIMAVLENILLKLEQNGAPSLIFGKVVGSKNAQRLESDLQLLLSIPQMIFSREPTSKMSSLVKSIVKQMRLNA